MSNSRQLLKYDPYKIPEFHWKSGIIRLLINFSIWFFLIIMITLTGFLSKEFLTINNIMNIFREAVIVGMIAIGMSFVVISGCFDLSSGAILGLCAIVAIRMNPLAPAGTILAVIVPVFVGALFGFLTGLLVGYLKMNAFITTLGVQYLIYGITLLYTGGNHVFLKATSGFFYNIGNGHFGFVPVSVLILILLLIIAQWVLSFTNFGQYVKVSGANEDAAKLSGVNVEKIRVVCYVILGICASLGGVVLASWIRQLEPGFGLRYSFESITAVVLGGTSLLGGRGNAINSFAGALIMIMIVNVMILLNISYNYQLVMRGLILIVAVTIEVLMRRRNG
jgi:ribose/xylose/arabinose/galactoside ABC-type transport system permease subunit